MVMGLFWIGGPLVSNAGASSEDVSAAISAVETGGTAGDVPNQFSGLINTLRGIAVVILLMLLIGAGMTATWGNTKLAVTVGVGGIFLFGAFWVVALVAESMGKPDTIPTLNTTTLTDDASADASYEAIGTPVKNALNEGLNILTSVTLPFILIYGLWLSLAVAAGESDAPVMRGYVIGAVVALAASILGQVFKII